MIALALTTSSHLRLSWTRFGRLVSLAACLLLTTSIYAQNPNPIQLENALPGTDQWELAKPALNREVEGYASATSINRNGVIDLFVNSAEPYTIEIFRMGCYLSNGNCLGARRMPVIRQGVINPYAPIERPMQPQITPTPHLTTGLIECDWREPYTLDLSGTSPVPGEENHWTSGVYLARLTITAPSKPTLDGKQSYIVFVVRNDQYNSTYLFQSSVTTFQAYNNWPGLAYGGKSLYPFNSAEPELPVEVGGGRQARKVSFNRPYAVTPYGPQPDGRMDGAGEFLRQWEYNMVRFLEKEGYDVSYWTNVDTHARGALLTNHRAFLSVGHDEYWSWQMRDNVELARESGVNLGFFSANTCYWQIRFEESSPQTGLVPDRTIVGYKEFFDFDPFYLNGNEMDDYLITNLWRDPRLTAPRRPENALIGVMWNGGLGLIYDTDVVVTIQTPHWVTTGISTNRPLPLRGLLGYEADSYYDTPLFPAPPGTQIIATSPVFNRGDSHMTVYQASSGATVFATGTIQWSWGLDNYNAGVWHPEVMNEDAKRMTRNVLARFAQ